MTNLDLQKLKHQYNRNFWDITKVFVKKIDFSDIQKRFGADDVLVLKNVAGVTFFSDGKPYSSDAEYIFFHRGKNMAIRVLEEHTLDTLFDPADSECCVCYDKLDYPIASVGCGRCTSEVCETCFYKIDECPVCRFQYDYSE